VSDAGVEVVAFDFDLDFDLDFVLSLGLGLEGVDDFDVFLARTLSALDCFSVEEVKESGEAVVFFMPEAYAHSTAKSSLRIATPSSTGEDHM